MTHCGGVVTQLKFSSTWNDVKAEPLNRSPSAPTPKPDAKNSIAPRLPAVDPQVSGNEKAV